MGRGTRAEEPRLEGALTNAERRAVSLAGELWNVLCREVVGDGPTRDADLQELGGHVHALQRAVLAHAAARAYPGEYRLMGEVLADDGSAPPC